MAQISTSGAALLIRISVLFIIIRQTSSRSEFSVKMTQKQYNVSLEVYIAEWMGKRCLVRAGSDPDSCINYCQFNYGYVPGLKWNNSKTYVPISRTCNSTPVCKGQNISLRNYACYNINGTEINSASVSSTPSTDPTFNVTIICQNGHFQNFLNTPDCKCDFGWGSQPYRLLNTDRRIIVKCNQRLPIWTYFPNFMKIYYNKYYDNIFPYGDDPYYWTMSLLYYLRQLKYKIISFIVPYDVQMMMIIFPPQPTLTPLDWIWFVWMWIVFGIICMVTIYERLIGRHKLIKTST